MMSVQIKYIQDSCLSFTWDMDGHCIGLRLIRTPQGIRVAEKWSHQAAEKISSIAEALSIGRRALNGTDSDFVIAGPAAGGWSSTDLTMPLLPSEELKTALSFELRKQTPLPVERITWGYRILPQQEAEGKCRVRLFYVRTENWRSWVKIVAGLSKLDLLAPAPVLLDPLLLNETLVMPGKNAFSYKSGEQGRIVAPAKLQNQDGSVLSPAGMLPLQGLNLGPISDLPSEEQAAYVPAILAAAYGMTRELEHDRKTLPSLPDGYRPHRNRGVQTVSAILIACTLIFLMLGSIQALQKRLQRVRLIEDDLEKVEEKLAALRKSIPKHMSDNTKLLEEELLRYKVNVPSLPAVLTELTRLIQPPAWMGSGFTWKFNPGDNLASVDFSIREPLDIPSENNDLVTILNHSPLIGDAKETLSTRVRNEYMERKFTMNARVDLGSERKEAQEYLKKQKELAAKAKEEEKEKETEKLLSNTDEEENTP